MASLILEGIAKRFGRRRLFRDLSVSVEGGRILGVTGANGSGKSTLLRIVAGVLTPDAGTVTLQNGNSLISREERPFNVCLVAPYLNVYDALTARENLDFVARLRGLPDADDRICDVLDFVGLLDRADDPVGTFSTGMKQRMRYGAGLLPDLPVLLLDEPSTNLDERGHAMVDRVIRAAREARKVVVIATNEEVEAQRCDDTIRIEDFGPSAA